MALLEVRDLTAGYGVLPVLQAVNVQVERQEIVAIVGPNGAGKSTLLQAMAGLLKPQSGVVRFDGYDVTVMEPYHMVRLGMGYVPPTGSVFASLTVAENLDIGAFLRHRERRWRKEEMYALFPDLYPRRRAPAGQLSAEQQQMLGIARALMLDPTLLLLDEPAAGLAPQFVGTFFDKLVDLHHTGVAMVIVAQHAQQTLQRAHRGYVLVEGQNRYEASGAAVLADPEMRQLFLSGF